ncbi:MAG TPA: hypothetical protein PK798_09715 [Flavobacteriales bacterium]|nr:hypothetical protein [Flavobacteriales bacterium]HRJ39054.1 hypothetical protein [Flavobacteriales bacterium]
MTKIALKAKNLSSVDPGKGVSKRVVILSIFCMSFFLFGNTLINGYSMDDDLVIKDHQLVKQGFAGIPKIFTSRYAVNDKQNYEYRPLTVASFAVQFQFFGDSPFYGHIISILLYGYLGVLIFYLLARIFPDWHNNIVFVAVLVFMVHPFHSEVVASIKNRDEILSLIFALTSIWFSLDFVARKSGKSAFFVLLFVVLSLLSKRSSLPVLFHIPLILIYFLKPNQILSISTIKKVVLPYLFTLGGIILFRLIVVLLFSGEHQERNPMFFENPFYTENPNLIERIPMVFHTIMFYVKGMFFPLPLISYYGYNTLKVVNWSDWECWLGLIFIGTISIFAIKAFLQYKPWALGWLYFLSAIFIFSNIIPAPGIVAERFAFSSSLGFSIIVASFINYINTQTRSDNTKWIKSTVNYIGIFLLVVCSLIVIKRNSDWNSRISLYAADIKKVPESAKMNSLLATEYSDQVLNHLRSGKGGLSPTDLSRKTDSAVYYFEQALSVYPDYIAVHNNLGTVLLMAKGLREQAAGHFRRAVELDSNYAQAYFNLGHYYSNDWDVYNLMKKSFAKGIDSTLDNSGKRLTEIEIKSEFYALTRVQVRMTNFLNGILQLKSIKEVEAKIEEIKSQSNQIFDFDFASLPFKPLTDSFSKETELNFKRFINNEIGGQPENVVQYALNKWIVPQVTGFVFSNSSPDFSLLKFASSKELVCMDSALYCLNRTLFLKKDMTSAYIELQKKYDQYSMMDSIISLNNRLIGVFPYQSEQLLVGNGNAYFAKDEILMGISELLKAIEFDIQAINRLYTIHSHHASAQNRASAAMFANWIDMKRKELSSIYYLVGLKYNEIGDMQNSEKFNQLSKQ